MYASNEILFPDYVTPMLRDMRGEEWRQLVDKVAALPDDHPDVLAFSLMMVRFNGCMECETDSYRAMRGCAMCATQTLRRYHGSDRELLKLYARAQADVETWLAGGQIDRRVRSA